MSVYAYTRMCPKGAVLCALMVALVCRGGSEVTVEHLGGDVIFEITWPGSLQSDPSSGSMVNSL